MNRKTRLYIRSFVLCTLITFAITAGIMSIGRVAQKKDKKVASKLPDSMSITGQTIDHYQNDKKLYTLRIGKFRICSKKIGFVKIGFLKIAQINNVKLDIFLDNQNDINKKTSLIDMAKGDDIAIFEHLETNSYLEAMIDKHKIKGIEIEDITIYIHRGQKIICSISSKSVSLDRENRAILFKGNSTIVADSRILKSHKISWQDRGRKFLVNGKYELINQDSVKVGECIETDFLLREIEFCDNDNKS